MSRLGVCLFALALVAAEPAAFGESVVPASVNGLTVIRSTWWSVGNEREPLVAAVTVKDDLTRLQILRKGRDRWTTATDTLVGDKPLNMFVTADEDGYLITQWVTGSGYIVKVFEYSPESGVRMVLDVGAKGLPDLVMAPGEDFDVAVIVRTDEQGVAARGGPNDNAAIFKLRHGATVRRLVAPWKKRFDFLSAK